MALDKMNGIIYYTDNRIEHTQVFKESQKTILASGLPIVSVSLRPLDFGTNIVLKDHVRSYPTMALQIYMALEASKADNVFFCEHDVLYSPTHWDFTPERDDIYYYNVNNYRWEFPLDRAITYSGLTSLSSLCCNRLLALRHYKYRLHLIEKWGLDKLRGREPRWARRFGYEPGTKKRRNGGVTNEEHIKRRSALPNVDIRHKYTFSRPKVTLDSFTHLPEDFREVTLDQIPGWELKKMFNL
jgi:hypothetical protein